MTEKIWVDLYCSYCGKITKHCHTKREETGLHHDSTIGEDAEPVLKAFNISPDADWECWACKTKGRKSIRKYAEDEAYLEFFIDKNKTQKEIWKNPNKSAIESLAKAVSYI